MKPSKNTGMLSIIAKGLCDLKDKVIFLGGAIIGLHITDPAAPNVRATQDVDCVVELAGRIKYYQFENRLRSLGFVQPLDGDHPICRWKYNGILVDIMPTDRGILGFSNKWYKEGIKHSETVQLPDTQKILVFSVPYLTASKLEAFQNRGKNDFLMSPDMEDIVALVDGCLEFKEKIKKSNVNVLSYLKKHIGILLEKNEFVESVHKHIESANPNSQGLRTERAIGILKEIAKF